MRSLKLKRIVKKIIAALVSMSLLTSCGGGTRRLSIDGNYVGQGMMGDEAVVKDGEITIYSTSFFSREVYWHGTCNVYELDENNMLISKRLEQTRSNDPFGFGFGFGFGMNISGAREKQIAFTDKTLTFVYDMSGMSINQVTLYKQNVEKEFGDFDSNAEKVDPNYKEPSIDLPPPPGQTKEKPVEPPAEKSTEATTEKNEGIILPEGEEFSL